MGTLILYATKSGATSECADLLAQKFKCVADDLGKTVPDISSFETVIIGSGIRMGKIYKPVANFLHQHLDELLSKRVALYFCNAYPDTFQKAIEKNIPAELIQSAVCITSFGGKPPFTNPANMGWLNTQALNDFYTALGNDA